jgi:aminomethyltransferase
MSETSSESVSPAPKRTPLYDLHRELGGRMVDFAGWLLPVQYHDGIVREHQQCREQAVLFDVSHMGQVLIRGGDAASAFERLVPGNLEGLAEGRMRYTVLTNEEGGIRDDLIVARVMDGLLVVVNAACRDADLEHMRAALEPDHPVESRDDRALLALQGPKAADVMFRIAPASADLGFMSTREVSVAGLHCRVSRSGYTGEDGFEISVAADKAEALARRLLEEDEVEPAGLGARDSLRLEAGLCLYGQDLTPKTTPIEAALAWTIGKRRREEGGFPGAKIIQQQLREGPARRLVGIRPEGRAPARAHTEIQDPSGTPIGEVTSGGFGPTVGGPVAMGYVESAFAEPGKRVQLIVRERSHPAEIVSLPFVPHRYKR